MKNYLKLLCLLLLLGAPYVYGGQNIVVKPINPIPSQSVEGTVISNIKYQIKNINFTDSYQITFSDLNAVAGKTFTTTCGTLAPSASCDLNITFTVPTLPSGVTSEFYPHTFFILGAGDRVPWSLSTTIVQPQPNIYPTFNIGLSDSSSCTGDTFTVTLTPTTGTPTVYNNVPCGASSPTPSLTGGTYTVGVTPSQISNGPHTYDSPASFSYHLAKQGDTANIIYQLNQDVHVDTDITAPQLGSNTVLISCSGVKSYSNNQQDNKHFFANMQPGQYTCTAANYNGTDGKKYTPTMSNPYTINNSSSEIIIAYASLPPTSTDVKTNLTMPNRPAGQVSACTISDPLNSYSCNQAAGISHCAQVVTATDYTFNCANYTVGSDVYAMPTQTNVTINPSSNTLTGVYSKLAPPGANYNWQTGHLAELAAANVFLVDLGGGSTTSVINISTNPPKNPWLISRVNAYINGTPTPRLSTAAVQGFPSYIAIGTVSEPGANIDDQLKTLKMDSTFHYVGNGSGDRGCYVDGPTAVDPSCNETDGNNPSLAYDPLVDAMSAQAADVTTATGHNLIAGIVFYTIDFSDGAYAITQDLLDDNLTKHFYNVAYEAIKMQEKITSGTKMVLFLNPDSIWPFQNCSQWNCPIMWKPGISQDTINKVITLPNLQKDLNTAIDRLAMKGLITTTQATNFKAQLVSDGILTPPPTSGRTVAGLPEYVLAQNWMLKNITTTLPFGWGLNVYDNNNPLLTPGGVVPKWATGSATWIHYVNHAGLSPTANLKNKKYSADSIPANHSWLVRHAMIYKGAVLNYFGLSALPTTVPAAIDLEAQKAANYMKDMNMVGNLAGLYKPDFIYFDKYERDPITSEISDGWAWNGVDWDSYLMYIKDIDGYVANLPVAIWQIPGASIQVQGATYTGNLAATGAMWAFGIPTLSNDFSNWDSAQKTAINVAWTPYYNTSVYYTANSNVKDLGDYLKLTNAAP